MTLSWNYGGIFAGLDAAHPYATQIQSLGRIYVLPRLCCICFVFCRLAGESSVNLRQLVQVCADDEEALIQLGQQLAIVNIHTATDIF